jgi:Ca2+-binding RTX toxin-like protein
MSKVFGTIFSDLIQGTGGDDEIYALNGNDSIQGFGGADRLDGGGGNDTAFYTDSHVGVTVNLDAGRGWHGTAEGDRLISIENVFGSFYADALIGNYQANVLTGDGGNDTLVGGWGTDTLVGGDGDDTLKGGGGADTLNGGAGIDTADYSQSPPGDPLLGPSGVWVVLYPNPFSWWNDAEGDTLVEVENITGSAYGDWLGGDGGANVLRGMNGGDNLNGWGGDDRLYGGEGNDNLDGGSGADIMVGGAGNDTYFVYDAVDVVIESAGQGSDTVLSFVSYALPAGADVETLRANGSGALHLTGNSSGNLIIGNDNTNVLSGGDGRDELTGMGGQDSFLFTTAPNAASNVDVINDFNVADDTIVLNAAVFGAIGFGSVAGSQFVIGTDAQDAGDRIIYNDATGAVYYDSDGTGGAAAVQFAQVSAGLPLTNFDFYVNFYF